jgi:peptidoglycan biosynthesis protein MviN/MurJ (putative lipid II flippase)
MWFKAGLLSLVLLLASRLLGLARESAQAAAFGASGLADLAVLMLTLPDWITGVVAAGALSYVLVPAWAGRDAAFIAATQRRVAHALVGLGLALGAIGGLGLLLRPQGVLGVLAAGLPPALGPVAVTGLLWSALALAPALLAALWATRLQHESDAVGLYGANLVVNGALVLSIVGAGWALGAAVPAQAGGDATATAVWILGLGLLAAMGLRLVWQAWRMRRSAAGADGAADAAQDRAVGVTLSLRTPVPVWVWAILSAGLPLALPFAARSLASGEGAGALAVFNYAWKLVELPLMLAIQLVATLAFPSVAAAVAGGLDRSSARETVRAAFGLAWGLACAAAAALVVGAGPLAQLLFGWGRMDPESLARVAHWGALGAWGLLPQAVSAVGLTVLASQRRLRPAAAWHALALAVLLSMGAFASREGAALMLTLNGVMTLVAVGVVLALGRGAAACLPWRAMLAPAVALLAVAAGARLLPPGVPLQSGAAGMPWWPLAGGLGLAALAAAGVLAVAWATSRSLRPRRR